MVDFLEKKMTGRLLIQLILLISLLLSLLLIKLLAVIPRILFLGIIRSVSVATALSMTICLSALRNHLCNNRFCPFPSFMIALPASSSSSVPSGAFPIHSSDHGFLSLVLISPPEKISSFWFIRIYCYFSVFRPVSLMHTWIYRLHLELPPLMALHR